MPRQRDDLDRLSSEYANRERRFAGDDRYSLFNPAHLFMVQMRQRNELKLLRRYGFTSLAGKQVLEIGCGRGEILQQYLGYEAERPVGIELLEYRAREARRRLPGLPIQQGDARYLPYPSACFDLVAQYTVFSSILDPSIRRQIAAEMLRVTRPETGLVLWYDFWWNPINRQTRGIRPAEVRALFPNCAIRFQRVTLAPPITRLLIPGAWGLAVLLESLKVFNSHYLAAITPL